MIETARWGGIGPSTSNSSMVLPSISRIVT
jgi:hypothetical protein